MTSSPLLRSSPESAAQWPLEPVPPAYSAEVANRYRYLDGRGEVGVISSISQPFCGTCTRARLSAIGEVYTCLFASTGHDLRAVVRCGADDDALDARFAASGRREPTVTRNCAAPTPHTQGRARSRCRT